MIKLAVYYHSDTSKNSAKKKKSPREAEPNLSNVSLVNQIALWITDIPKNIMKHSDKTL